ncbi:prepilin peptidase [Streptomyces antnestii]|uniref:Prepilin peptidase n=1 Tax=Streptomyces antnestii TaxID=2494256 RepID=A0A3S2YPS3_9ACTN|nr:A24 family peptidase [Streptomyces sp. San01]RVU16515.1 prepilin peptidase [Streptomyces sp. San01]
MVDVVPVVVVLVAAAWGAVAGLLVPRAAYRLGVEPDENWLASCPDGHPLPAGARGWLGRGRCGTCGRGLGPGSLLPVTVTTAVCAALAAATGTRPELAAWLLLAPPGVLLAVVDARVRRLPDVLTLPLAVAAPTLLGLASLLPEPGGHWSAALLGALLLGGGYLVLFLIHPQGLGFGDVKLAVGLGAVLGWYGWGVAFIGTFAGFLFAALYGAGLVLARRAGRRTAIPFGPFLLAGALTGVLLGAYAA